MSPLPARSRTEAGFTLVELMVTLGILAVVTLTLTTILLSSNRLQSRTVTRAEVQASTRQALSIMTTELRQAGADPSNPPAGIVGIAHADSGNVHIRADLSGDGAIQTAEPSEDVTYNWNPATQTLSRDPGTGAATLLTNVSSLRFTYFDASNNPLTALPLSVSDAALVHVIGITMTTQGRDSHPLTLTTKVTLRNM